jgi:hypothetical protein
MDRGKTFRIIDSCHLEGRDLGHIIQDMSEILMDVLKAKMTKDSSHLDEYSSVFMSIPIKGSLILSLNDYFWDVILKIRQNVSEDIVVKTSMLKSIGIVAESNK